MKTSQELTEYEQMNATELVLLLTQKALEMSNAITLGNYTKSDIDNYFDFKSKIIALLRVKNKF